MSSVKEKLKRIFGYRKFFSSDEFKTLGLNYNFKEDYYSINKKNVIRGIHKTHKGCKFRWKDEDIV